MSLAHSSDTAGLIGLRIPAAARQSYAVATIWADTPEDYLAIRNLIVGNNSFEEEIIEPENERPFSVSRWREGPVYCSMHGPRGFVCLVTS